MLSGHEFRTLIMVTCSVLTLTMSNFLNGNIHLPFMELSILIFRVIKMKILSWSANRIEPLSGLGVNAIEELQLFKFQ